LFGYLRTKWVQMHAAPVEATAGRSERRSGSWVVEATIEAPARPIATAAHKNAIADDGRILMQKFAP